MCICLRCCVQITKYALFDQASMLERRMEYVRALSRNLANPEVAEVHVLAEDVTVLPLLAEVPDPCLKIRLYPLGHRAKYSDLFYYASRHLPDRVVMIVHADIYAGVGFSRLPLEVMRGKALALSRTDDMQPVPEAKGVCARANNPSASSCCSAKYDG